MVAASELTLSSPFQYQMISSFCTVPSVPDVDSDAASEYDLTPRRPDFVIEQLDTINSASWTSFDTITSVSWTNSDAAMVHWAAQDQTHQGWLCVATTFVVHGHLGD